MTKIKKVLLLIVALAFILPVLSWAGDSPVYIRGIRPLGMGNAFTAVADDQNDFFYNPAGLTQISKWQMNIASLPITVSNDTFDLYKWINDNQDQLENFDQQSNDVQVKLMNDISNEVSKLRVHVSGSILNPNFISSPMGLGSKLKLSWGIGVFDSFNAQIKVNTGLLVPNIDMSGSVDGVAMIPVAIKLEKTPFDLPGSISLAGTIKMIERGRIDEQRKSVLEFEEFKPALQRGSGTGLDFGSLYQFNDQWNFGLMVADIFGTPIKYDSVVSNGITKPETTNIIDPRVNVGAAWRPQNFYYWKNKFVPLNRHFVFAMDVNDLTNNDEKLIGQTFFKKVHLGGEYQTKMLALRGGFNSGYPSFGVGLNLWLVKLDYAFYGDELGMYAGQIVEWNHMISASIGF
jgi:hypothetical protein